MALGYTRRMARRRIGLFGGTFDPPHVGHLVLAGEAAHQLQLQQILWTPAPSPPHKDVNGITRISDRMAMLQLATAGDSAFEICSLELERPGPHFTVDTLRILREIHSEDDIVLLIGEDSLEELPTWHAPVELIALCAAIGVMRRQGSQADLTQLDARIPGLAAKVKYMTAPLMEIASSDIRRRVEQGLPYRYHVTPLVYEYIENHGLYR